MKFWFGFIIAVLMHFGCKSATGVDATSKSISANAADRRIMSKGVMRLKTTYTLDSNQFSSTCAAVLIHTPEPSLNYCVAITAAHCFRHIPDYAQHSLEIIDGKGDILKSHRVSEVTVHPEFTATDAAQTFEQAASDVALLEFKCALPEAIQPALVLDVSAVTSDAKFFTTKFMAVKTEQKSGPMDTLIDRLLGHEPMSTFPIYLFQSPVELLSVDFPGGNSGSQLSSSTGVLNLSNPSENDVCSGDAGAPAFAQIGQETYLIATASSGTGFCDKEKLLYSITSSHAKWINKTLETEVVVPRTSPEPTISAEKMTESKTKKLDSKVLDLSGKEEYLVKKIPSPVAIEAPTLTIPSPVAASSLPKPLPTVRPQSAKHQAKKAKVISPPRIATPAPAEEDESAPDLPPRLAPTQTPVVVPTVSPIPPPPPQDAVDEVCLGIRLTAKSKSTVWGTVVKLVDKDFAQISDESLKCELANDNELCVVGRPTATGTGNSRVVLSQSINQPGCSKFYSGRAIYILQEDFQFMP